MSLKHFTKEIDYRLVDLVESKPLLWDCTSDIYRRTDLKIAVWDEIAKQLGPNFTATMVSNRFKNIKDTFSRNLRAMKESKRSGIGTDNVHKPKWHMFERLMFLKKACVQGNSISNIPSIQPEANATPHFSTISSCNAVVEDNCISKDSSILNICYNELSQDVTFMSNKINASQDSCSSYSDSGMTAINNTSEISLLSQPPTQSAFAPVPCNITTQIPHQEINLVSAATKKRTSEDNLFCKRGSKLKKSSTLMEEAVDVLKQFCTSDPPSLASSSQAEILNDTAHTLALFMETRLRTLPLESRKECENEIMQILTKY